MTHDMPPDTLPQTPDLPRPLTASRSADLRGTIAPPGDKSISHRSIMFGGIAHGTTVVRGLLEGEDVLATVAALRAMGAEIRKDEAGLWHITGIGWGNLRAPEQTLDMGNSGTSARLLMGLVAGRPFATRMTGDASLCKRPMARVMTPLSLMGARFESTDGKMPLTVFGAEPVRPIGYELPVASAQVKSAILLAGLSAEGVTTVIEKTPTRDHSENMLRGFGAKLDIVRRGDGADVISLQGRPHLTARPIAVPADPSSAAFPLVAALLCPGSRVTLTGVGINPRRAGLFATLQEMGARLTLSNLHDEGGEPVADLIVESSELAALDVPPERAPSMIDEYPILAVAAACARGTTRLRGLSELRVKESDRLALVAQGLSLCGVKTEIEGDDLIVHGTGAPPPGGATVPTVLDHRIAMSFLIHGLATRAPVAVDDGRCIATSFPSFVSLMTGLGAQIA